MTIQEDGQNRNEVLLWGFLISQLMRHEAWEELFDLEGGNPRHVSHNCHSRSLQIRLYKGIDPIVAVHVILNDERNHAAICLIDYLSHE